MMFEEVDAESEAVKQAVLRHVPPGTPLDQAKAILEEQGFTCRQYDQLTGCFYPQALTDGINLSSEAHTRLGKQRDHPPLYCLATRSELEKWHLLSQRILVVLVPDEARRVKAVEVGLRGQPHHNAAFFKSRPDLHDPEGLPVAEAEARMEAAGFRCTLVENGADHPRPYLSCEAFDEVVLGGHIVRVHLYPDDAGVIRETRVLDKGGWFDAERCMWLHGDESPAWAVGRGVLFPVREGCRYTLITAALVLAFLLVGACGMY
jgi:hypothetical protein